MCNCSKEVSETDCARIKKKADDPEKRFFIYHIFDDERGLQIAYVPNGKNPNDIAHERNFYTPDNQLEWYNVKEHPCIYKDDNN